MRHYMHRAASVAFGTIAILGLASCGATDVASSGADRVIPAVTVSLENKFGSGGFDSVSTRKPLEVRIHATDNFALFSAVTRIFADSILIDVDSTGLNGVKETSAKVTIS